jgi:hypothetical protein
MDQTPIFGSMGNPQSPPPPLNPMNPGDLQAQVDALVKAALSEVETKYQDRIKALEDQLKAVGPPASAFTAHAAGPGHHIVATWSQWLQEASRNGTLTADMMRAAGIAEEVIADVLKVA